MSVMSFYRPTLVMVGLVVVICTGHLTWAAISPPMDSPTGLVCDTNQVTGLVKDPNDQVLANVHVTEFQTDQMYTTDNQGKFTGTFGVSNEKRWFFAVDKQRALVGVGRLAAGRNHLVIRMEPAKIVSGTVLDPNGKPVSGAQVAPLPMTSFHVLTDDLGRFDVGWQPKWAGHFSEYFLLIRSVERHLAGGIDIGEETNQVEVQLDVGLRLGGTVTDPNGQPISGACVGLDAKGGGTPVRDATTDARGHFEFRALPRGVEYGLRAGAPGYLKYTHRFSPPKTIQDCTEGVHISLKKTDRTVSGIVVNEQGRPTDDIPVYLWGQGQPRLDSNTDQQGRFTFTGVCSGPLSISAKDRGYFGITESQGGAGDVKIVVRPRPGP